MKNTLDKAIVLIILSAWRISTSAISLLTSVGHRGDYGHEFLEFEINDDGRLRYSNSTHYKKENIIRREGEFMSLLKQNSHRRGNKDNHREPSIGPNRR